MVLSWYLLHVLLLQVLFLHARFYMLLPPSFQPFKNCQIYMFLFQQTLIVCVFEIMGLYCISRKILPMILLLVFLYSWDPRKIEMGCPWEVLYFIPPMKVVTVYLGQSCQMFGELPPAMDTGQPPHVIIHKLSISVHKTSHFVHNFPVHSRHKIHHTFFLSHSSILFMIWMLLCQSPVFFID